MKLPPMNALRAFEAVSRHGSVSRAAEELCVTQGAVSQQLRNLEDFLGREIFDRTANSIELSREGRAFAVVVQTALGDIARAAGELHADTDPQQLTISTWQGFAIKWLMPNLGQFYAQNPNTTVALDESTRIASFRNDGIDGAIRFGDISDKDLNSVFLFHPSIRAVASPDYLAVHGYMQSLTDPGDHHLIDHHYPSAKLRAQHIHWGDLVDPGILESPGRYTTFPDERQAFTASLHGRGVCLSSTHTIETELAEGKIEYAAPGAVPARGAIHFVWPADARPNPVLDAFRDWLIDALGKYREG